MDNTAQTVTMSALPKLLYTHKKHKYVNSID